MFLNHARAACSIAHLKGSGSERRIKSTEFALCHSAYVQYFAHTFHIHEARLGNLH